MKLTKNTRLSKKPFKALDGATIGSAIGSSVGESASKSAGNEVKKSMGSGMSPTSFDYSNLATTGMAMGVGAIENQQAQLASVNKAPSLSGEMGKGALKGAGYIAPVALNPAMLVATGGLSALAVPVAAGIGAGVNYVTGNKKINAFNSAKETARKNFLSSQESFAKQNSQYNMLDAVNRGYSAQGSNMSSFYKNGGVVYKQGGSLNPISSDTKLAVGRSHEQGGIKLSSNAEIEGGETVVDKGDHTLVVSDNLVNPITGRTFAKDDLRLAKLARKYEGATTQLAKNSLKHIQAKREALHGLQQQMNGDASDMDTAQNGGKVRPINILTKPVKTSPRPSTHLAENGIKLYQKGGEMKTSTTGGRTYKGGSGSLYNINSKGERFIQKPGGQWVKTDKFPDSVEKQFGTSDKKGTDPVDFSVVGRKDNTVIPSVNAPATTTSQVTPSTNTQPSTLKGDSIGKNLRKAWDKTKEVGEAALPTLSRAGKLASYAAPALAQYYANKADIARQTGMKIPDAPQQGFQSLAKQNMEADRAAIRKQQADFNAGVAGTLADSQTAALLKANMASKAGDALVGVNQAERNANIATANAQTEMNLGIDARNKLAKYQQAGLQLEKDIDLSRRRAGNVAELSANLRDVQNTNRQEKYLDMDSAIKVAGLDERGQDYLTRQGANPKGYWMRKNGGKLTKLRR